MIKKSWMTAAVLAAAMCGPVAAGFTVVIDPGHGGPLIRGVTDGSTQGHGSSHNKATSASGKTLEKDLTLAFALAAAQALRESPQAEALGGVRVVLTRTEDRHVAAMMRAATAVQNSADVFLSIHFNGFDGRTEGTRAYYCAEDHPDWQYVHFINPYAKRDRAFGLRVAQEVAGALKPLGGGGKATVHGDESLLHDGIRTLGLARLDTHLFHAAVALLEVEFIDNPKVEQWLMRDEQRSRAAVGAAIAKAVCDYLAERNKWEVMRPAKAPGR